MAISELITSPSDAQNRSAYPSLAQPQWREDGYFVRFRVDGDRLSSDALRALVRVVESHKASIGITAYGEVEISGIAESQRAALVAGIVETLPLAKSLPVTSFPAPQTDALIAALQLGASALLERLSPALRVVVDADGKLSELPADVRFEAKQSDHWAVTLGGGKPQVLDFDTAVSTSLALLSALAALGPQAGAKDLFVPYGQSAQAHEHDTRAIPTSELLHLADTAEKQSATIAILPLSRTQITQ